MAKSRLCSIPSCCKPHYGLDLCVNHYQQRRYAEQQKARVRNPPNERPRYFFDNIVLSYAGDDCLTWPFSISGKGYGQIGIGGRNHIVSRLACEHVNGPPPTPTHQAAHTCGNGHLRCVNPRHVVWKTPAENSADRTMPRGTKHHGAKLTAEDVSTIRQLHRQVEGAILAKRYGVSKSAIFAIHTRKSWSWLK